MIYLALAGIVLLIITLIFLVRRRCTSTDRGEDQIRQKLMVDLEPIVQRLADQEKISSEEIAALAHRPEYRWPLYNVLKDYERLELFPQEYRSTVEQGAGLLAYVLIHPDFFGIAPAEIELVEQVERVRSGIPGTFFVYRFRMPPDHKAHKDGWLLGLAGPFVPKMIPYEAGIAGAYVRPGDQYGRVNPHELVDWYIDGIYQ